MRERSILFSAPMVRAILDGRKTQTRRVVKPQPPVECSIHYMRGGESWRPEDQRSPLRHTWEAWGGELFRNRPEGHICGSHEVRCPYGQPGDRLWVRETHAIVPRTAYRCSEGVQQTLRPDDAHDAAIYREGFELSPPGRWRPSIHMPRWASRITLEVTGVRVERLNAIREADALAEGIMKYQDGIGYGTGYPDTDPNLSDTAVEAFRALWETINGPGSWDANPFVWVVEFKRITP